MRSSEPIRVLEVLASLRRAGAERVAVSLASALDRTRFAVEVVSLYDAFPEGFEPLLAEAGIAVRHHGKRQGFDPRMFPRLMRTIRAFTPAIVHTHSYVMRYVWPANTAAGGGRIVHTVHNLAGREVDRVGRMIHLAAFRGGKVTPVAVGKEVAASFRACYGVEPRAIIYNGVDLERFSVSGERWKRAHGFSADDRFVVSVARLDRQKNPLGLIDAFHRGVGNDRSWRLLLAGKGSLEADAAALAARLGIADRVHFLGLCNDVEELLAACDIFALASDWEGMPVAVMEAMAAGLPVAAAAAGGVCELVEHAKTGLLAPVGDVSALAAALAELAGDAQRRQAFGRAARERAARYGVSQMVRAYAELFDAVASEAARR